MHSKFIKDLSASTVQVLLNQLLGLVIFLVISRYLSKELYGEFNWSLAVLVFCTSILSLRLEQIIVRRIASGQDSNRLLTLFAGHIFFSGLLFYLALYIASLIFPDFFDKHPLLLFLAISQLLTFFSSPFKQLANGKEQFRVLAIMSTSVNIARAAGLLLILLYSSLESRTVILLYIFSSLAELLACVALARFQLHAQLNWKNGWSDYKLLIRESMPQVAVVFLNASIARIDWILLGLFSGSIITAEYSFAYKVFELSPFPLLIISPILLSRFSKFAASGKNDAWRSRTGQLARLIRIEMIAATVIPLLLNLAWSPVIDALTKGKYGAVNEWTFFILSCSIPFLYMNNLLWSVHFAENRLHRIFKITLISFIINLAGNLISIPLFAAKGAALVYLLATIVEYFNYMRSSPLTFIRETWTSPLACSISAVFAGLLACWLVPGIASRMLIALPVYSLLLLATKQLQKSDIAYIKNLFKPHSNPGRS